MGYEKNTVFSLNLVYFTYPIGRSLSRFKLKVTYFSYFFFRKQDLISQVLLMYLDFSENHFFFAECTECFLAFSI